MQVDAQVDTAKAALPYQLSLQTASTIAQAQHKTSDVTQHPDTTGQSKL
jgi:hypothetical protein